MVIIRNQNSNSSHVDNSAASSGDSDWNSEITNNNQPVVMASGKAARA